jgi:methylated-DNA-protein-cysteine methyltransferase-like protein
MIDKMDKKASFFQDVYEVARLIPYGRVTTYGAIAEYLGLKSSARMVGWAMNGAHAVEGVPAHRVVNRNGLLTGRHHFETPTAMQEKLEQEGIQVVNGQVQNFKEILWEPKQELTL